MEGKVVAMLSEILKTQVDKAASSETLNQWDSLAHMKIIVGLEDMFGIEIEDEELPKLQSFDAIINYLNSKIDAQIHCF